MTPVSTGRVGHQQYTGNVYRALSLRITAATQLVSVLSVISLHFA